MLSDVESELNEELGQIRALLARERRARVHRIAVNRIVGQTSGEVTRRGVAEVIAAGASDLFASHWVIVAFVGDDEMIQFVHGPGVPEEVAADWQVAPVEVATPIAEVLRGDLSRCELASRSEFATWPILEGEADRAEIGSLLVEPVPNGKRPHAVIALGWRGDHSLDAAERELLTEMVDTATPAFARAEMTEADSTIASTFQNRLQPDAPPAITGLEIATLYQAGSDPMEIGGDWYDVVAVNETTSSIVIGDVVGHDARAAADMGHVRHVLASHLLATGNSVTSLQLADRYFSRLSSNTMATALVMTYDAVRGTLEIASAGHVPAVLAEVGVASRILNGGLGPPIGSGLGGYSSLTCSFPARAVLVAFTDGVVELRDQTIDEGIGLLCNDLDETIAAQQAGPGDDVPLRAFIEMLERRAGAPWRTDDAAAIIVRLLPLDP